MSNLLWYRFLLLNTLALAGFGVLTARGYVLPLFAQDTSYISIGIVALFVIGLGWTAKEVLVVSRELNLDKSRGAVPALESERDKDTGKTEWLSKIPEWLVTLGLLGTVIGFFEALSAIDVDALSNAKGAQTGVANFMAGMRIAIITTIVGAVTGLWMEVNVRLLKTGLSTLWADRISATYEEPFE